MIQCQDIRPQTSDRQVFSPKIRFLPLDPKFCQWPVCSPRRGGTLATLGSIFEKKKDHKWMQHCGDKTRGGDVLDFIKPFLGVSNLLFISFHKTSFLPTIGDIVDWICFYSLFHFLPNPKTCCFPSSWGAKPHLAVECVDQLKTTRKLTAI